MKILRFTSVRLFLAAESALYVWFLLADLFGADSKYVKYTAIVLCFLFALYLALRGGDRLMAAALGLTVAADTFLLLLEDLYGLGVALFLLVQILYLFRIRRDTGRQTRLYLRLALLSVVLCLEYLLALLTPLHILAAVYFSAFIGNVIECPRGGLFFWGLLLFLCCDICVGISNAPALFPVRWERFAHIGMWLFYLPGQVLLVLSGITVSFKERSTV